MLLLVDFGSKLPFPSHVDFQQSVDSGENKEDFLLVSEV